jgi:hypothetical protein
MKPIICEFCDEPLDYCTCELPEDEPDRDLYDDK